MRIRNNVRALSTIIWLILILCSIIFGALLSYIWVLGNYYAEPVNSINLVITNATFPINHADRFNITVLNTSNSIALANITQIYVTPEGLSGLANVTNTSPESLPIIVDVGVTKTIQCKANWGQFSGYKLNVHLVTPNATIISPAIQTKPVVISVLTYFNPTISVQYFNASITNDALSAINVTISDIFLNNAIINKTVVTTQGSNSTESLPKELDIGDSIIVKCSANWTNNSKPMVTVETQQGYFGEATKNVSASVGLLITNVSFDDANPNANDFNVTFSNAASSATNVDLTNLILTTGNGTKFTRPLDFTLLKNQTKTVNITWPWKNYRDESLTLIANTTQGFTSQQYSINTPQTIVFDFTPTFNLTDTGHFKVNVTNEACSLQSINVTGISARAQNSTATTSANQTIASGANGVFSAAWNWVNFKGKSATITIITKATNSSKSITLPAVDMRVLKIDFNSFVGIPYANVTITNNAYSNQTVTITQVSFTVDATTFIVGGTLNQELVNGTSLPAGSTISILCPWNWTEYSGKNVATTVQTKEGFTATNASSLIP